MSEVPQPSVSLKSFACPHCGAHAAQTWFNIYASANRAESRVPTLPGPAEVVSLRKAAENVRDSERREQLERTARWAEKMAAGEPFFHPERYISAEADLANVNASSCHTCQQIALWVHDRLIYPPRLAGPAPNADLPDELKADFEEARRVVDLSPRGAAALLRLLVQKLCAQLGEKGKNIDEDIASLVARGLDPMVQQALDAVRVIGNEAVHPGTMDLKDDRDTALTLLELVNDITAQTIARKKRAAALYMMLPPGKRAAIDQRDGKAGGAEGDASTSP